MKQCPFCHTQVPDGASVCTGCGAYEKSNSEVNHNNQNIIYLFGLPLIIYVFFNQFLLGFMLKGFVTPFSTIPNIISVVLIIAYIFKFYVPWSEKKMWYRKH